MVDSLHRLIDSLHHRLVDPPVVLWAFASVLERVISPSGAYLSKTRISDCGSHRTGGQL
jgi:hypothetical protein